MLFEMNSRNRILKIYGFDPDGACGWILNRPKAGLKWAVLHCEVK